MGFRVYDKGVSGSGVRIWAVGIRVQGSEFKM
jgi:hypothetical protein